MTTKTRMPTPPLLENFLAGLGSPNDDDATATAILDATQVEIGRKGIDKASLEAIAKRAGVNRVTLYRRYTDRDGLMAAWATREGARMAQHLLEAVSAYTDPRQRLAEGFIAAMAYAQSHPFVRHLVSNDPATLVGLFRADNAALMRLGGSVMAQEIRSYQAAGHAMHLDADLIGEVIARTTFACVLVPDGLIDIERPETVRAFAEGTLVQMVFGDVG